MRLSSFNQIILDSIKVPLLKESFMDYFKEQCLKCKQPIGEHEWNDMLKDYECKEERIW